MRNCFCKKPPTLEKKKKGKVLSILVNEELLLQGLSEEPHVLLCYYFQSSWMRNCFCKDTCSNLLPLKNRELSILVNEELLLQDEAVVQELKHNFAFNPREWGTAFASIYISHCYPFFLISFNPREWGTAFASSGQCNNAYRIQNFQSSWMRNCFCKKSQK